MTDRYTKAVLTVIAAVLVVLVAQNSTRPTVAQSAAACGSNFNPCYVTNHLIDGLTPLTVRVKQ
jgi:hypothetical protein